MSSSALTANVKSALLMGWRERWSDEHWGVAIKRHFPQGASGDVSQLADVLLEQTLVGPSPNLQLLSYLRHAVATQMVSCSATVASLVKQLDVSRGHCMLSLLHFTVDTLIPNISTLEDCLTGNLLAFCKSALSLLVWLLNIILKSIQQQVISAATDKAIGLPVASIDGAFSYGSLIERACDGVDKLTTSDTMFALLSVAVADDKDLSDALNDLTSDISTTSSQLSADRRNHIVTSLDSVNRLKSVERTSGRLLELSSHSLNVSVNTFVGIEAILGPTNDSHLLTQFLQLMRTSQGLSRTQLYVELIRSSLMLVVDVVGGTDEVKCSAFMFLKLPHVISQLEKLEEGADDVSDGDSAPRVYNAVVQLLTYMPLLDVVDTKCNCDCLQYLLHELTNKYSLLTEEQRAELLSKRCSRSLRSSDIGSGQQQSSPFLVLRAETTVASILNTLDADYSKNPDAVLGILCQMLSGKSFELIHSAAAVTSKLPVFAAEFIKFNEMAKSATGETGKAAQTRALLFDMTFIMLVHIVQLYGLEVISSNPDTSGSFLLQWGLQCWPEEGKYKCLEPLPTTESNRLDVFLGQLGANGSELKLNLARWNEVCQTASFAIQELLNAWQNDTINSEKITIFLDNLRSSLCCLSVVTAATLCNYVAVSDGEVRLKAVEILHQLQSPPSTSSSSSSSESSLQYYTERSHMMYTILSRMVSSLTSAPSLSHNAQPSDSPQRSQSTNCSPLLTCLRGIHQNGCVDSAAVHRLDLMMTAAGPVCYTDQLVHALLSYDRPQDLHQAIGILYSLFHLDIDNLTLSLLNVTLPNLLLQSFPAASPTLASGSGRASALSSSRFLSDPRGGALAKLCVLCINLMCAARRFTSSADDRIGYRGKRPTRADILLEQPKLEDDDDDIDDEDADDDVLSADGKCDDAELVGAAPCKTRRQTFDGPVLPLDADSTFALPVSEFISATSSSSRPHVMNRQTTLDSKDLLSRSLVRLFLLMQNILSDKLVSPRTAFVAAFMREVLKLPSSTLQLIRQCMPRSLVSLLVRTLPSEFSVKDVMNLHDLSTSTGRRTAARVIVQHDRHTATSYTDL